MNSIMISRTAVASTQSACLGERKLELVHGGKTCWQPKRPNVLSAATVAAFALCAPASTDGMKLLTVASFSWATTVITASRPDGEDQCSGYPRSVLDRLWHGANKQFNAFVNSTGYKTESERFGWSFRFLRTYTPKQH